MGQLAELAVSAAEAVVVAVQNLVALHTPAYQFARYQVQCSLWSPCHFPCQVSASCHYLAHSAASVAAETFRQEPPGLLHCLVCSQSLRSAFEMAQVSNPGKVRLLPMDPH